MPAPEQIFCWFFAIFLLHSLERGISSIQLAKYLGVTQKTGWFMLQRIRYALEHEAFKAPLGGIVEIDEIHHVAHLPSERNRKAVGKKPIVGILEQEGELIAR